MKSRKDLLSNTELEGTNILDLLQVVAILFLSLVSILGFYVLIQKRILRWIGISANNEETYRTHQRSLDILFDSISLFPLLIVSFYWGVYLVVPLFEMLTGYESPNLTFGITITMLFILTLLTWELHKVRHTMLEEDAFSKTQDMHFTRSENEEAGVELER